MTDQFSPDSWLTTAFAAFTDYISTEIDKYVRDDASDPVGLQVYDLVMDYPHSDELPKAGEFTKTIIHLSLDDVDNRRLGFGDGVVSWTEIPGVDGSTLSPEEAQMHTLNFDVGVWASDQSGGVSSRLRAYEMLDYIFNGEMARQKANAVTGGVEIIGYQSGRFVPDKINDIRVFRVVGAEVVVRVFSRKKVPTDNVIVDGELIQDPNLVIDTVPLDD